ncbi:hypothetical protein H0H93_002553 [Arthromyces matolae]|nr:hypothetical protein H0H93_002553 [Arthromyces matolae]
MNDCTAQLSSTQYASRRKELLSLLKQLRATGQALNLWSFFDILTVSFSAQGELDLPRITVIGNQSAGKSSVVEAISGINVPRDAGTCTRCPIECRLANSPGKWSCTISIRCEYDADGKLLEKVSEERFGEVITDKDDVEPALRRAQAAVLNPHLDFDEFVDATDDELSGPRFNSKDTVAFSEDTICIDLEGPELTDLSFVDLPGNQPSDDIENQKALRLAHQEDPDGRRTIGVMTKPDMLTAGSKKAKEIWLDIIEGRRHPLAHGYFCTRQPDDVQRSENITPAEARRCETEFFSTTAPWSSSSLKDRFGTNHLVSALSKHLVGIINDTLPRIMKEAASKLDSCTNELATLPKEIDEDPSTYMLKLITGFSEKIHHAVYTGLDVDKLIRHNQETFREYKSAIRKTAPNFVPAVSKRDAKSLVVDELAEGNPFYLDDMRAHIRESIARELPNNVPFPAKVELITRFQARWESATDDCFQAVRQHVEDMLDGHVKNTFQRYQHLERHVQIYIRELVQKHFDSCNLVLRPILQAEETPFTQNTHYLSESTSKWSSAYKSKRSGNCDQSELPPAKRQKITNATPTATLLGNTVLPSSSAAFANSTAANESSTFAAPRSANGAPSPLSRSSSATSSPLSRSTSSSSSNGNTSGISTPLGAGNPSSPGDASKNTEKDFSILRLERKGHINAALSALAALGFHNISEADFGKMVPPDEYEAEIQVMADVRGYFQVAYKRVIDTIPALIDLLFVRAIADDMQASLITKFSLGTVDAKESAQGELDLPRITVIGNQSAGKSSVVEAISGINVPRDAGTCTRCPIECRLANSPGKWTCIISIRREYDTEGKLLEKVSEKRFGEVITEKKDVEPALRRAQMAILNPHISTNDFVHASDAELAGHRFNSEDTLKFSDDTICIDLEGPELTDLSFVDLPGLIQNADPALIEFVEELIVRHIKGNCLILVALPMTGKFSALLLVPSLNQPPDDIENQKAVRLARQEDPDGRRTIGRSLLNPFPFKAKEILTGCHRCHDET